jgi:hypothetical protein
MMANLIGDSHFFPYDIFMIRTGDVNLMYNIKDAASDQEMLWRLYGKMARWPDVYICDVA